MFEQPTVLIVDDDPLNIKVLGHALSSRYKVKTAINGQMALDIASAKEPPDLILLDIQMPDLDGHQVLMKLKSADKTKSIPVIFITSNDAAEDEAKGLELGAMDYIVKPFNIPVVMARVRNQISLKQKADLLERLVSIDGLTEIPNRRNFNEVYTKEWRRCSRAKTPLSMIMIDIDCFKQYNDTYGHTMGDDVLKKVALTLKGNLKRGSDFVARYGGEEFVVLLPNTDYQDASQVSEKLRMAIEALEIPHAADVSKPVVTISLGLTTIIPSYQIQAIELQDSADRMLYQAKEQGKNQVCSIASIAS